MNRLPSTFNSLEKIAQMPVASADGAGVSSKANWVEHVVSANNLPLPHGSRTCLNTQPISNPVSTPLDMSPSRTARFTDLPPEIRGKIFSYLNLPELMALEQLGDTPSEEARFAFKHFNHQQAKKEIFEQIRLGNRDALVFCRERLNEVCTQVDPATGRTLLITAVLHGHLTIVDELVNGLTSLSTCQTALASPHYITQ